MVDLRVPDVIRDRLQRMLKELIQAIERLDKIYCHIDLVNIINIIRKIFFSGYD
jgi:hypothetical protein